MLQTIRDFAAERLEESGEAPLIRDRHLNAFIALAQQAQPHLFGPRRKEWLDRLEEDIDNFRVALEWAVASGKAHAAMSLSGSFWRVWQMRGHIHEGRARLKQILALPNSGEFPKERLAALEAAGGLAYWQADMEGAQRFYDESLELTRQVGDKRAIANAIYNDAFPMLVNRSNVSRAKELLEEALPLFRDLGDEGGTARTLWGLGNAAYFSEDYAAAKPPLEEAHSLFRRLDDRFMLAWSTHTLGVVAVATHNVDVAKRCFIDALRLFVDAKDVSGITLQLDNLSVIARSEGDPVRATRLAAAAVAQQTVTGTGLGGLLSQREGRSGREGLPEKEAATAWAEGQALTLEEAIAYALDPTALPVSLRDG
jgi:tetratricopeptide (TPR) repeat protein